MKYDREYICPSCFLVYPGAFVSGHADTSGREPCPNCGEKRVHATDTFSSFYFEENLGNWFGEKVFEENYWTLPERPLENMNHCWANRHEPNPNRPDYWKKISE